jgi:aminoglycoside/choline kinase family phosphotransferase
MSGERLMLLEQWLDEVLPKGRGALHPASADASFRQYWRFESDGRTLIAVDAPPPREDSARFARLTRAFRGAGLNSPEVFAEDHARGFLVVSDLGSTTYLQALTPLNADRLYGEAIASLVRLQCGLASADLPTYDVDLLQRELGLFRHWLLEALLGLTLSAQEVRMLDKLSVWLVESALAQPLVAVHRDYHSRNLMVVEHGTPGVLDLQDAVNGPLTYDLVSLLKDCYVAWPRDRVLGWVSSYATQARASGIGLPPDEAQLVKWFDLMGAQRHMKAAGIFARLKVRDGKAGYLADLPRTLQYLVELGAFYPQLRSLGELISCRIRPRLAAHGVSDALMSYADT